MAQSLSDYFALEAGDYLEQMDGLLHRSGPPDLEQIYRLARGVRGSAQLSQLAGIARVAEPLEHAARAGSGGGPGWGDDVRACAVRTVDDLKVLVRAVHQWGPAEDDRVSKAVDRWRDVSFAPVVSPAPLAESPLKDRLYPFVRDELAAVVAELDASMREVQNKPDDAEPLKRVLQRMRAVRGVRGANSLGPVMEVLEGIEDLTRSVLAHALPVDGGRADLLAAARSALAAAMSRLARGDAPDAESDDMALFRALRDGSGTAADLGSDVVPIGDLFFEDDGPHIVESPLAPLPGEQGTTIPAAVLDFLRMEATSFLDRAEASLADVKRRPAEKLSRVSGRLADLALAVRELALTYGLDAVAKTATGAADRIRAADDLHEIRAAITALRGALPGTMTEPAHGTAGGIADEEERDVISIDALLLRGPRALEEALTLRGRFSELTGESTDPALQAVLGELFDLVQLGLQNSRAA